MFTAVVPDAPKTLNIDASLAGVPSANPATSASPLEQAIDRGDMAAAIEALAPAVELLPYQLDAVAAEDRFTWSCWSRQVGKSFTFSLRRLLRGLIRRRNQIILSAGERQSREVMEKVRMHCRALRIWHEVRGLPFYRDATIKQLEARLPGGGDVRRKGYWIAVCRPESNASFSTPAVVTAYDRGSSSNSSRSLGCSTSSLPQQHPGNC